TPISKWESQGECVPFYRWVSDYIAVIGGRQEPAGALHEGRALLSLCVLRGSPRSHLRRREGMGPGLAVRYLEAHSPHPEVRAERASKDARLDFAHLFRRFALYAGTMTTAVSFQNVSRHFGSVRAVDDVDLDIAEGEFFAMLGPSGSGKTTCLRLIAGFEQPTSGHIEIFGETAEGVPPYRRNVNTVFQDYALF